jgi:subtilase-type serine protease
VRVAFLSALILLGGCSSSAVTPNAPLPPSDTGSHGFGVTPFNAPDSVFPGATSTEPTGIRDRYITATVTLSGGATLGGLYNRAKQTWSQIVYPGAQSTAAYGPKAIAHGVLVAGSYKNAGQKGDDGFAYDSTTGKYAPIIAPAGDCAPQSCNFTIAHSVFGGSAHYVVVGNYDAAAKAPTIAGHAFLYDSATKAFTTIDVRNAASTTAYGIWIDGKTLAVAGGYADKKGRHAYVRDLTGNHFLTYDYPLAALTHFEGITGAGGFGNYNVAGDYTKPRDAAVYGFYLQIRNWKPWPPIVIGKLSANSVDVRTVIGVYNPGGGPSGFITTLPVQDPP